ncbi:MAG: radical SAM protein [Fibrobacter sp.]|nr:radical SAM protein [Fibrobacter sp.]
MIQRLTLVTNPDVCNLRCPLCFLNQRGRAYGKGEMPLDVAIASIEKYGGAGGLREVIPSTMGEPLLYSKFAELLDYCSAAHIPMNLTTNGTFPGVWGSDCGTQKLVRGCSDIKVSCMGFSEDVVHEMMPGISFDKWKENVLRLLEVAGRVSDCADCTKNVAAAISLQVTLHKKMLSQAREILAWAESVGIDRIKWNLPVFLASGERLRCEYDVLAEDVDRMRNLLKSDKVRCEGSLFFDVPSIKNRAVNDGDSLKDGARGCSLFEEEIWVMPDGSVQYCPNPEKRFGDPDAPGAKCESCLLFRG